MTDDAIPVRAAERAGERKRDRLVEALHDLETFASTEADNGQLPRHMANAIINKVETVARYLDASRPPAAPETPEPEGLRAALERLVGVGAAISEITPDGQAVDPHPRMWHLFDDALEQGRAALASTPEPPRETDGLRAAVEKWIAAKDRPVLSGDEITEDNAREWTERWFADMRAAEAELRAALDASRTPAAPEPPRETEGLRCSDPWCRAARSVTPLEGLREALDSLNARWDTNLAMPSLNGWQNLAWDAIQALRDAATPTDTGLPEELRRLSEAATPGEWEHNSSYSYGSGRGRRNVGPVVMAVADIAHGGGVAVFRGSPHTEDADAAFIAAAANYVRHLQGTVPGGEE